MVFKNHDRQLDLFCDECPLFVGGVALPFPNRVPCWLFASPFNASMAEVLCSVMVKTAPGELPESYDEVESVFLSNTSPSKQASKQASGGSI